jgi:transcriptional regulator with XRE-family HTH domain
MGTRHSVAEVVGFGARLRELRQRLGLTAIALAAHGGVTAPTISLYEHGYRLPSLGALCRLADALHVTTDELLGRASPGEPEAVPTGREILDARQRAGLGQREAALRCGVSRGLLADIELGRRANRWTRAHIWQTLTEAQP